MRGKFAIGVGAEIVLEDDLVAWDEIVVLIGLVVDRTGIGATASGCILPRLGVAAARGRLPVAGTTRLLRAGLVVVRRLLGFVHRLVCRAVGRTAGNSPQNSGPVLGPRRHGATHENSRHESGCQRTSHFEISLSTRQS